MSSLYLICFAIYIKYRISIFQLIDQVQLFFLDVGQGDASIVTFPNNQIMLIDCGKDATVLEELGNVFLFYERHIDYMVVTHPDLDHFGGCIDVFDRFAIDTVFVSPAIKEHDRVWQEMLKYIQTERADVFVITQKQTMNIAGVVVEFLYPNNNQLIQEYVDEPNNLSVVFKITFGTVSALFTGDIEKDAELYLADTQRDALSADILKVAHHGSDTSSYREFLQKVNPMYAVISVGADNTFGHPSDRVLFRLLQQGIEVFRTDHDKQICVSWRKTDIQPVIKIRC